MVLTLPCYKDYKIQKAFVQKTNKNFKQLLKLMRGMNHKHQKQQSECGHSDNPFMETELLKEFKMIRNGTIFYKH